MASFNQTNNKLRWQIHCPYCGNIQIIDYGETFECPICQMEFDKVDIEKINDEIIFSINDIIKIIGILKTEWGLEKLL